MTGFLSAVYFEILNCGVRPERIRSQRDEKPFRVKISSQMLVPSSQFAYSTEIGIREDTVLLHNRQHLAGVYAGAYRGHDPLNCAFLGRLEFVLHLHGFDYEDALAGFYF